MKKGLLTLFILVLMVGLVGCSGGEEQPTEKEPATGEEQVAEGQEETDASNGTLTVATSADFPPFEYIEIVDGKDQIVGFDIDLMKEIGKELGKEVKIENMTFDGIVAAVQTGKVDIGISGLNPEPEREEKVNFSDPYYYASQALLVKEEDGDITSMDQLEGKVVGSQIGSTSDQVISEFEGVEVKKYDLVPDAVQDLNNERIDAVVVEDAIAAEMVNEMEGLKVVIPEELKADAQPFGIIMPKEEEELLNDVNTALQNIIDSGKYDELTEKHGLTNTLK